MTGYGQGDVVVFESRQPVLKLNKDLLPSAPTPSPAIANTDVVLQSP